MNTVSQTGSSITANSYAALQTEAETAAKRRTVASGNVIGTPKLSDKAQEYYQQLQQKYSNMDFVLVSQDKKEMAQSMAGSFAKPGRTVVLIDDEKIERMATDEAYREKYESIISGAENQLNKMQTSLGSAGNVTCYGMQVQEDGKVSFFAVVDKSLAAQRERIAKRAAEKKEERKKAQKEEQEETREKRLEKQKGSTVTVTASSVEELLRKIEDAAYESMSDRIRTEEEKQLGQHIDFRG